MSSPPSPGSSAMPFELPLFPLNLVLYPGMFLPLHIFEERYRNMIGQCLEDKKPFGVVLIKEGAEVGGNAVPVRVGTTARILDTQPMGSGRMNILTRGEQRFELLQIVRGLPHQVGRVRILPDTAEQPAPTALAKTRSAYTTFLERMALLAEEPDSDLIVPGEPTELSFAIASKISACVKLPAAMLQNWLQCESAKDRLAALLPTLENLNEALEQELLARRPPKDLKLN